MRGRMGPREGSAVRHLALEFAKRVNLGGQLGIVHEGFDARRRRSRGALLAFGCAEVEPASVPHRERGLAPARVLADQRVRFRELRCAPSQGSARCTHRNVRMPSRSLALCSRMVPASAAAGSRGSLLGDHDYAAANASRPPQGRASTRPPSALMCTQAAKPAGGARTARRETRPPPLPAKEPPSCPPRGLAEKNGVGARLVGGGSDRCSCPGSSQSSSRSPTFDDRSRRAESACSSAVEESRSRWPRRSGRRGSRWWGAPRWWARSCRAARLFGLRRRSVAIAGHRRSRRTDRRRTPSRHTPRTRPSRNPESKRDQTNKTAPLSHRRRFSLHGRGGFRAIQRPGRRVLPRFG